jgi:hypothetical protein
VDAELILPHRAEIAEHFYQLSSIRGGRRYFRREWGQFDAGLFSSLSFECGFEIPGGQDV